MKKPTKSSLTTKLAIKESNRKYYITHREQCRKRCRNWYEKNREKVRENSHNYYIKNKQKCLEYSRRWTKNNRSKVRYFIRIRQRQWRLDILNSMGGKCVRCGFSDKRALQIDHVNGGGVRELKKINYSAKYYRNVLNSYKLGENKYQLLCANCNWIKRHENKECNPDETYKE